MSEKFDLYIDENDGMIYRHFPPEHSKCSPVFDSEGINLEQSETELIEIFEVMKVEIERLRLALTFALRHCSVFVDGTKTCESSWHDEAHSSHSTCPSCNGPVDMTPHVSNRRQVTRYTSVSERVAEMLADTQNLQGVECGNCDTSLSEWRDEEPYTECPLCGSTDLVRTDWGEEEMVNGDNPMDNVRAREALKMTDQTPKTRAMLVRQQIDFHGAPDLASQQKVFTETDKLIADAIYDAVKARDAEWLANLGFPTRKWHNSISATALDIESQKDAAVKAEQKKYQKIRVIFDKAPGNETGRFVEVEDLNHRGMQVGEWIELDGEYQGMWALELTVATRPFPEPSEIVQLQKLIAGRYSQGGRSEIDYQNEIERLRSALPQVWDAGFSFACQNSCVGVSDDDQTDYRQRGIDAVLEDKG